MCTYRKIRGAKIALGVMLAFAIIVALCSCAQNSQSGATGGMTTPDFSVPESDSPSLATTPVNAGPSDLLAMPDSEGPTLSTPYGVAATGGDDTLSDFIPDLPLVTDYSYWRLVRQCGAQILPGTVAHFKADTEELFSYKPITANPLRTWEDVRADNEFPHDEETGTTFSFYRISSDMGVPGDILAKMDFGERGGVTVSVPELPDDLAEYARSRGESWYMVYYYRINDDGSRLETAILAFYQDVAFIHVWCGEDPIVFWVNPAYNLRSQVVWSFVSADGIDYDQVDIDSGGRYMKDGCSVEKVMYGVACADPRVYSWETIYYYDRENVKVVLSDERAQFTETSYMPSPAQFALLKDMMAEFESEPLPEELLN